MGKDDIKLSLSKEALLALNDFPLAKIDRPEISDHRAWAAAFESTEKAFAPANKSVKKKLKATVESDMIGGVDVLRISPHSVACDNKILIHLHGGGYTFFSPQTSLISSVPMADACGLEVISIDYTRPPKADWRLITDQVIGVIKGLIQEGFCPEDIGIYGESAGGSLAAGSQLKAIDQGIAPLGALIMWSPWSDISECGDTYQTLRDADPMLIFDKNLSRCADLYANGADKEHPYISPVYGDYSNGFPPTLIQAGTREIFLSNAIRHYQALDKAGITVKLDLYDGLWHVFQAFHWYLPESKLARRKCSQFLKKHLVYG